MPATVTVTFEPPGVSVSVPVGTTVLEAARRAGVPLASACGGRGTCGDCAVRVVAGGVPPPSANEAAALRGAPADVRLGCLLRAEAAVTVRPVSPIAVAAQPEPDVGPRAAGERGVAAAIDLGTTGISAALLDRDGLELAVGLAPNPQRAFGGDVASRISAALEGHAGQLQSLAAYGVSEALGECREPLEDVRRVVVAGNTAMSHLVLGAEVSGLAAHPYHGSLTGTVRTSARAIGLEALAPGTAVVVLPPVAAFVGGDATAGILATGMDRSKEPRILIDLGTNAEVVVAAEGTLTVASAAAGPAFEAAGLACGGPAQPGAIRGVRLDDGFLALDVIGRAPPKLLCGSGALALLAVLLDAGHLDPSGRLHAQGPLRRLVHRRGDVAALQIAGGPGESRDIYLTQLDVRELQLAKAAVATALELTLAQAGMEWGSVVEVLVAGAFGAGVDIGLLRRLGVLPSGAADVVRAVGNSALAGAEMVAADESAERRAETAAASARALDLAAHPAFMRRFVENTALRPLP